MSIEQWGWGEVRWGINQGAVSGVQCFIMRDKRGLMPGARD